MKSKWFTVVGITLLILCVFTCLVSGFGLLRINSMSEEISSLKANSAGQQLAQIQSELKEQEKANSELSSQIEKLNQSYEILQNKCGDLQSQITNIRGTRATVPDIKGKVAYLTFDDGPSRVTPRILDILKANQVHATFFVVGTDAQADPSIVKRAYQEGNVVGIHSWTHDYSYIYKNENNFFDDFNRLKNFLTDLLGACPTVCRYPGGSNNTVCQRYSSHIMRAIDPKVKAMGIRPFDWNAYAGDAESGPKPTPVKIVSSVLKDASREKVTVILMHDTAVNEGDVTALPNIIRQLKADGYTFDVLGISSPGVQFIPT